jgi:hypothetical protein
VPPIRREEVFRRTAFIRNAYGFEHDHVFNRGVPVEEISRASRRPIRPITIVHDQIKPGEEIHRGRISKDRFMIYKPAIAPSAPRNPAVIRSLFEKRAAGNPQRRTGTESHVIKRQNSAARQTIKNERLKADNAKQEKYHLEKAAHYEDDSKKQADFKAEADIQSMKVQRAQDHVDNIRRWNPSSSPKSAVIPRSRVVPQPSPENRQRVRSQVRDQVQREAQVERQRERAAEEMVRKSPSPQPRVETGRPRGNESGRSSRRR